MTNSMNKPELETLGYKPKNKPERPGTIIIKTIQALLGCMTNELDKLDTFVKTVQITADRAALKDQARKEIAQLLEDVNMLESTTLFDLQKAVE